MTGRFSERQLLALCWWNREKLKEYDALICDGAVRSGKTFAMVCGFFLWAMCCFSGQTFALCGRTVTALRRNVVRFLPQWLGAGFQIRDHRAENRLQVSCDGRVNDFYLFGGQDEASCKQIQGITLAGILLDEVALMPRSFVEQALARCSVEGSKMWFNCNPEGPEHWFYKNWICKAVEKNALRLTFTMDDNPGLSRKIRQRYERMYTGVFYRRFILGQWCVAEGLVYDFQPEKHIARQLQGQGRYFISVDYGTMNPFSAGLWRLEKHRAVRLREFYYNGRDRGRALTDEEYYEALVNLAGELSVEQVIVDPSAASLITLIRRRGQFSVRKARNQVLPGIRQVASLLQAGFLQFAPGCEDTIREFGLYRWQDGTDQPVKEHDHAMDDIRYFCATVIRAAV